MHFLPSFSVKEFSILQFSGPDKNISKKGASVAFFMRPKAINFQQSGGADLSPVVNQISAN